MSIDAERFFGLICSVSRFCWYGFIWDESPSSAFLYLKIYNPLYHTTCGDNSKSSFLFYSDYGHLFISWYSIDVYQTTFLYFILGTWRLYSIHKITHKKSNYFFSLRFMRKVCREIHISLLSLKCSQSTPAQKYLGSDIHVMKSTYLWMVFMEKSWPVMIRSSYEIHTYLLLSPAPQMSRSVIFMPGIALFHRNPLYLNPWLWSIYITCRVCLYLLLLYFCFFIIFTLYMHVYV